MVFAGGDPPPLGGSAAQIYGEGYFSGEGKLTGYPDYAGEFESHRATFADRLRVAEQRLGRPGRVLDVGCALGHLAKTACDLGWDVYATDISRFAVARTRADYGIKVFVSDPCRAAVAAGSMDLITLYDVIEHLPDPQALLRQLAPLLRQRGWLHITTPNVASLSARVMGKRWYHCKAREHLLYFSPRTLTQTLQDSGFDVVEVGRAPSRMSVDGILRRLRRYAPVAAGTAMRIARQLGWSDQIVRVHIGECQAWARPRSTR